jgi:hypothetical protein
MCSRHHKIISTAQRGLIMKFYHLIRLIIVSIIVCVSTQGALFANDRACGSAEKELARAVAFEMAYVKILKAQSTASHQHIGDQSTPHKKNYQGSRISIKPYLAMSLNGRGLRDKNRPLSASRTKTQIFTETNQKQQIIRTHPGILLNLGKKWTVSLEGDLSEEKAIFFSGGCEF